MIKSISVNNLYPSKHNVRTTPASKQSDTQLKSSIQAVGVLQNLLVMPSSNDGQYEVIGGGRRLRLVKELIAEGKIPNGIELECKIKTDISPSEISLIENIQRAAMHPADEFMAFQSMIDEGLNENDIAAHFGVTKKHVKQRLRLANVAPLIINEYRKGNLDLDCVMAFTVSDDHEAQITCWNEVKGGYINDYHIRNCLLNTDLTSDSKLVKFVSLATYKKAGGTVSTDLFEDTTYILDADLIKELTEKKLDKHAEQLKQAGWSWVLTSLTPNDDIQRFANLEPSYETMPDELKQRITTLENQLCELENSEEESEELLDEYDKVENALDQAELEKEQYRTYSSEDMARGGCIVSFDHNGKPLLLEGLIEPSQTKTAINDVDDVTEKTVSNTDSLSKALVEDIAKYRQQIIQSAVAENGDIAFDILLYTLCADILGQHHWGNNNLLDSNTRIIENQTTLNDTADTVAAGRLSQTHSRLQTQWLSLESGAEQFSALRQLSKKDKQALLAYCVSRALSISSDCLTDNSSSAAQLINDLEVNFAEYWRPTKDNYFSRIRKQLLLKYGEEFFGQEWISAHRNSKNSAIAEQLAGLFTMDNNKLSEPQLKIKQTWLPECFSA